MLKKIPKNLWLLAITIFLLILGFSLIVINFHFQGQTSSISKANSESQALQLQLQTLELADDAQERMRGLMYRKEMCKNCGMFFVFEEPDLLKFWMKNTFVPLDIIFIKIDGTIDSISKNATPQQLSPTFDSKNEVKYVLEVNAGWAKEYNLEQNIKLDIDFLIKQSVPFVTVEPIET